VVTSFGLISASAEVTALLVPQAPGGEEFSAAISLVLNA
jgi:hypothetical protein